MKRLICAGLIISLLCAAGFGQEPPGRSTLKRRPAPGGDAATEQPAGDMEGRIADLTQQITREMSENQKRTVAVVEFVDLKGRVTDFGRFLAEELITRLYQTRKFKVIERQLLNKIISEQKLSLTGIIDQTSAQKLGRLLGVDAIASGTVTDLGRTLKINARLIDTSTAEVFAVASTEIVKDESVSKLMGGVEEGSGAQGGGQPGSQPGGQERKSLQKVNANFFTIELQQCRLSGTTIICDLLVTNNDRDRSLGLSAHSVMIDDSNNTYEVRALDHVRLANATASFMTGDAETTLVSGVTAKARVMFTEVSPEAKRIALLVIKWDSGGVFQTRFRDIPLGK